MYNEDRNHINLLKSILNDLYNRKIDSVYEYKQQIDNLCLGVLNKDNSDITQKDIEIMDMLLKIGNITYNNTSLDILPIEDGVYDLLLEKYKYFNPNNYQVGATSIQFAEQALIDNNEVQLTNPLVYLPEEINKYYDDRLFNFVDQNKILTRDDMLKNAISYDISISKRLRNTPHSHPELVGTLDKCKFVLCSQVDDEVLKDPNVKVLERDFFQEHINSGLINMNDEIVMIAELKYDGISVEADCTDVILTAHTRGDTAESNASDLTPIFAGYRFPNAVKLDEPIGIKFEAIITYNDLAKLNELRGTSYINGRTAIIGLLGSSDAYKYREFITLVPLETTLKDENGNRIDRLVEIEFMNRYYTRGQLLRYNVLSGTYVNLLFQIKRFVEEAELARSILPFMYDGVVLSYYDPILRHILGRVNSVNKYSIAVKFNAMVKETIFRGYTYTVGKDGTITPMIHYDPVEFLGSIHTKSTGHSLARFKELNLAEGDIIRVTYVNDVMPYVSNSPNNKNNGNPVKFIEHCPSCGTKLIIPQSGAIAICPNMDCKERCIQRLSDTLSKLNIKDFSEESIRTLYDLFGYKHLYQLFEASLDSFSVLGDGNKYKLKNQLDDKITHPIKDYKIIGCLGFSNMAFKTWKLIFQNVYLYDLFGNGLNKEVLESLSNIKGIGEATIKVIENEYPYFKNDIDYIIANGSVIENSKDELNPNSLQIRFTGFRDKELTEYLCSLGHDADDNAGVTKSTDYLLIPYEGYNQGNKMAKASKYGVNIVPVDKFKQIIGMGDNYNG